jgi:hypothetical protein
VSGACKCGLAPRVEFKTPHDYENLTTQLNGISSLYEVPVQIPYDDVGCKERWFRCSECGNTWRLVDPDPPFLGVFEKVIGV